MSKENDKKTDVMSILKGLGYKPLDRQEKSLSLWEQFFIGKVKNFHEYTEYMGKGAGNATRKRKSLKMAKAISEIWADNIINPETEIVIADDHAQKWYEEMDANHNITPSLNDLMELIFAFGTGSTLQSRDANSFVFNQYIKMQHIYPLEVKYGEVVSCAFASQEEDESFYLQIHELMENGKYLIKNLFYDKQGKQIINKNIVEQFESDIKLFQLYKPAIVNNVVLGNPLGISIYANAVDELKAVDIAYDALDKEIRNGRMRIFVSGELLHREQGEEHPIFNKDQDEFYILPEDAKDPEGVLLRVEAPTLRVEQLINNLEKQLNMLGSKCGLGENAFYSDNGTIYTNTTQVISTNSKFYKTRQKHATRIEKGLIDMVKALYYLEFGKELNAEIHVDFDDSIIHDKEAEYNRARLEYSMGLISAVEYMAVTRNMTETEAVDFYKKQIELMGLQPNAEEEGAEV